MEPRRRQLLLLGALGVTLAVAAYIKWPQMTSSTPQASSARAGGSPRAAAGSTEATAPDVHLEALDATHPKPGAVDRNLFKFKPKPAPPPVARQTAPPPPPMAVPTGPPPPPPITLKFIGVLEPDPTHRIAILSDGRGAPVYGKEGDTVLGQYRILRIGAESIEMAYLDGRGRQTIRLSGS